jgi:hypothetical protein
MMTSVLTEFGGVVIVLSLTLGPVIVLIVLLNLRDRREGALLGAALEPFASRDARGRVAVQVRCAVFSRRSVVTIDMRACSRKEVWNAIARLSESLPPRVRLVVGGTVDRRLPVTFTVESLSRHRLSRPAPDLSRSPLA